MANAKIDENHVPTAIGRSSANGTDVVVVDANATTHRLYISDGVSGTDFGNDYGTEQNHKHMITAVSSADGVTPVIVYVDPATNRLLVKST